MDVHWARRVTRVERLIPDRPAATELLSVCRGVLELQSSVSQAAASAGRASWTLDASVAVADAQARTFSRFARDAGRLVTPLLAEIGERLSSNEVTRRSVLNRFLAQESLEEPASVLGCESAALEFFPRAFMQPVAEVLVSGGRSSRLRNREARAVPAVKGSARCPACRRRPQVSLLRDETDVRGQRWLVCSLCATEWVYPRSMCPQCGETDAKQLDYHVSESWPHLRVEECSTCRTYHKALDLRIDGAAVPMIDDVASVELDLWARERGLTKIQVHLLGL